MAQSPITVIDGTETAAVARVEINGALEALATLSSGTTAPSTTFSGMFWHDTSTGILKIRSEADDAWINVGYLDQSTNEFKPYVGGTQVDTQPTADWEAGTSTTEGVVSPAKVKAAVDSLASGGFSTRERLDGSGTFTVPTGVSRIRVYIVGAGGAGADEFADGATGGSSSFGTFSAGGGVGGNSSDGGSGGFGGGTGCAGNGGGADDGSGGGSGGFGGGGAGDGNGGTDGGGGGGRLAGGGGGGGLNIQEINTSPGTDFSYNSGSGGFGGGGAGGDGFIIVEY